MDDQNINTEDREDDSGFDESQIPEDVRKRIEKRARDGYIPKDRYDTAIGNLKDQMRELDEKISKPAEVAKAPPKFTRAQLREFYNQGKIDEDQMDEIWANQVKAEAIAEAQAMSSKSSSEKTEAEKIGARLIAYKESIEGLDDPNSDNRQALEEAYQDLIDLHGKPSDNLAKQRLEAMACRAAFGAVDKLKGRVDRLKRSGSTSQEEGSSSGVSSAGKAIKGIPQNLIAYYEPLIARGMYKNWDDVRATLKHASPAVKQRQGIK